VVKEAQRPSGWRRQLQGKRRRRGADQDLSGVILAKPSDFVALHRSGVSLMLETADFCQAWISASMTQTTPGRALRRRGNSRGLTSQECFPGAWLFEAELPLPAEGALILHSSVC